jgi:2-C-methyl-D-erythritol 4-phosphate cytidylyltransferase
VSEVVVAVPAEQRAAFAEALGSSALLVDGGATRTASVRAALAAVDQEAAAVLVHDAARPLTPPEVVARVLAALDAGAPAVVPVLPVVDTTVLLDDAGLIVDAPDRDRLRRVQTPQGFRLSALLDAYARLSPGQEFTDDAAAVRAAGLPVGTVAGDERAAKITVPHDLELAELQVRR